MKQARATGRSRADTDAARTGSRGAHFLEQTDLDPITVFGDSEETVAAEMVRASVEHAAAQLAREATIMGRPVGSPEPARKPKAGEREPESGRSHKGAQAARYDDHDTVELDRSLNALGDHHGQRSRSARPAGGARPGRGRRILRRSAPRDSARLDEAAADGGGGRGYRSRGLRHCGATARGNVSGARGRAVDGGVQATGACRGHRVSDSRRRRA